MSPNTLADIESVATGENSEVIKQLVETVSDLTDRVEDLEEENEQLRQQIEDHTARMDALGNGLANANEQIEEMEAEEARSPDPNPTPQADRTESLTPIERLSEGDEGDVVQHVTPSVERAVTLYENVADWGSVTPKGTTLRPADNPKQLLEAARGESLAWQQYHRAAEALEQLSRGAVTFVDSDRHGKTLVLHDDTAVHDRLTDTTADHSRPSLART
ncbi:MAG: hypothetical protein J07HR59_00727 [Halorubrum sp. J07HR59]|jgi:TolA-binding protein|nr:MAG: hypothetical protein J07HR59_00727 [Halorubrum sp. J07HR59]